MRPLLIVNLIAVLCLCPVFCGAEGADHGSHWHGTSRSASSDTPATPGHCPEDGDNCICQGAIESAGVRVSDTAVLVPSSPLGSVLSAPPHPLAHHLTCDGTPTGLAGWGSSHAVRAFLQNFRC